MNIYLGEIGVCPNCKGTLYYRSDQVYRLFTINNPIKGTYYTWICSHCKTDVYDAIYNFKK